jgi:hypothetical protein
MALAWVITAFPKNSGCLDYAQQFISTNDEMSSIFPGTVMKRSMKRRKITWKTFGTS